jgi:hypothetical protein
MRNWLIGATAACALICLVAGCGTSRTAHPRHAASADAAWHPATLILLAYAAPDGSLTRAQLETGLRRDFDRADTNHDGCLDENEVRAVNQERWKQDASTASPLIDFEHNGCVNFDEFAATARTLFEQLDRKGEGKLTADQLKPGSAKPPAQPDNPPPQGRHRGGSS